MKNSRIIQISIIVILALLLFIFGTGFLLCVILLMIATGILADVLLKYDSEHMKVRLETDSTCTAGESMVLRLYTEHSGRILAASRLYAVIDAENVMLSDHSHYELVLELNESRAAYVSELPFAVCGQMRLSLSEVSVMDALGLFRIKINENASAATVVYPRDTALEIRLSQNSTGSSSSEGISQNRRGNDPTEIYDLRDYIAGDDMRTIHWKLSQKLDRLTVKESSDNPHYDVLLMPDIAARGIVTNKADSRTHDTESAEDSSTHELRHSAAYGGAHIFKFRAADSRTSGHQTEDSDAKAVRGLHEFNGAAALTAAAGRSLLRQGIKFCMAVPSRNGFGIREIKNERELEEYMPEWLSIPICEHEGTGLRMFISENLEQYFSRLIIISAGQYNGALHGISDRMSVSVICAVADKKEPVYFSAGSSCMISEIPADPVSGREFHVIC